MRCGLVSAPTTIEFTDPAGISRIAPHPPLGLLTLASLLRQGGVEPVFVDLDELYLGWLKRGRSARRALDFPSFAGGALAELELGVYGLGTICSSYPMTIRVARALKAARPEALLVLGGPQATPVAEATLRAFDAIDLVVRGEADRTFPALLAALQAGGDLAGIAGLTFRARQGPASTPDAAPVADLDALPLPAYELYGRIREVRSFPLEAGRGCPFACSFCATSAFFRRRFRMKSPEVLLAQLLGLRERYDVELFSLIHDNFVADPRRLERFCTGLIASGAPVAWGCSARTDGLDPATIDLMARAGCRGLFLGVESGSARIQRAIGKDLDLPHSRSVIRHASRRGIKVDVALISGFPEERRADLRRTAGYFTEALRHEHTAPQITLLAPLPGTRVHEAWRSRLVLTEHMSDLAFQGWDIDPGDRSLVAAHPDVFSSFYAVPTQVDRRYLFDLRRFLLWGRERCRLLLVALQSVTGDVLEGFDAWQAWLHRTGRARASSSAYYRQGRFEPDFLEFMGREIAGRHPRQAHAIGALVALLASRPPARRQGPAAPPGPARALTDRSRLALAEGVALVSVDVDLGQLLRRLGAGRDLAGVARRRTHLVTRTCGAALEIVEVGQAAEAVLRLVDGERTLAEVVRRFARSHPAIDGLDGRQVCALGVRHLLDQGLLRVARARRSSTPRSSPDMAAF